MASKFRICDEPGPKVICFKKSQDECLEEDGFMFYSDDYIKY